MSKYKSINAENINLERMADIFKALSNPHRLKIYNILTSCCTPGTSCVSDAVFSCCVGDLDSQLNIAASTLSHHLKELNQASLINMQREGKQIYCSINTDTLKHLQHLFSSGILEQPINEMKQA